MAEVKKTNEIIKKKIKAIYPHIVVGGKIDTPYYSIQWYDVEKKTMIDAYGSYKLEFVRKCLQEDFEVVENDIADLIKSQQEENDRLENILLGVMHFVDKWLDGDELKQNEVNRASAMREKTLQIVEKLQAENKTLINNKCEDCAGCTQWLCDCSNERTQAIKEYTEKLIFEIVNRPAKANPDGAFYNNGRVDRQNEIIDIIQELASNVNFTSP